MVLFLQMSGNKEVFDEVTKKSQDFFVRDEVTKNYTYAILQETNGGEMEAWLTFIRYQGNENALNHLQTQLESIKEWYIVDDMSTFDLELAFLVCEQTAKDMTRVDLNATLFHRKFDGKLQEVELGFKPHHSAERKMEKAFKILGYGKIENFLDEEDKPPEELEALAKNSSKSSDESASETESHSEDDKKKAEKSREKVRGNLPKIAMHPIPRYAKAKKHRKIRK